MQDAELMIGYSRDGDLLSTILILFLIGGSELCFPDMNDFTLKIMFAAADNLAGNTPWIADVNKPITFINFKVDASGSVNIF